MNLAESAAAYLNRQPALAAAVARIDANLQRCAAVLHPAPVAAPVAPDPARATRRHIESALRNHAAPLVLPTPVAVPACGFRCKLSEATGKAKAAKASTLTAYTLNANQF